MHSRWGVDSQANPYWIAGTQAGMPRALTGGQLPMSGGPLQGVYLRWT